MQPAQPQTWAEARPVQKLANHLINQHHSHLATVEIRYFFYSKEIMQGDKQLWGRARKITGLNAVLANSDTTEDKQFFVIEIWRTMWDRMTEKQRAALVDHELEHCWVDENDKLAIAKHDVEEFTNVIRRHGLWRADVQSFVEAANGLGQQDLFEEESLPEPEDEGEPGYQNVFPIHSRPDPRQLGAAPSRAISTGSTGMPGSEPRQLGAGNEDAVDAEIIDEERRIQCPECHETFMVKLSEALKFIKNNESLQCPQGHLFVCDDLDTDIDLIDLVDNEEQESEAAA